MDSADNIHISYRDNANGHAKYATNASGAWVKTTVDWSHGAGVHTSIGVDSTDKAHISYGVDYPYALKYATNAYGFWVNTTLLSDAPAGYTSLALDTSDKVHISFLILGPIHMVGLGYATNVSGSWETPWWDSAIAGYTSIAVDSLNNIHISYNGFWTFGLGYATNAPGTWVTTTVDSDPDVAYTSIAVDSADKVHISYYDGLNKDLKYATNASGSWVTSTIDSAGDVGSFNSIAVDSLNNIHISYYDDSNNSLKYATNAAGSWVTETACDRALGCGEYSSIAVSSSGTVRISHYGTEGTLLLTSKNGPSCVDNDGDGYGDPASAACVYPQADCDDSNPEVNPGHVEVAGNGIDDDCDGKIDEACFIATAAFGTMLEGKIEVLRSFRDTYLLTSPVGRVFLDAYYRHSPPIAQFITEHAWLKALVRTLLLPVVGIASLLI
jgi:hypothetical protein